MQIIGANLTPKKVSVLCKVEEEHEHACACGDTMHSLVDVDVDGDIRPYNMTSTSHSLVRVVVILLVAIDASELERLLNIHREHEVLFGKTLQIDTLLYKVQTVYLDQ